MDDGDLTILQRLHELHGIVAREPDLEAALRAVLATAVELVGSDRGCLRIPSRDGRRIEVALAHGHPPDGAFARPLHAASPAPGSVPADQGAPGTPRPPGPPEPPAPPDDEEDAAATLQTPIAAPDGDPPGVLAVQLPESAGPDDDRRRRLDLVAAAAAAALARHRAVAAEHDRERQVTSILDRLPVAAGILSPDGRLVAGNAMMREIVPDVLPSLHPDRARQWHACDADGRPVPIDRWPVWRALRGDTVVGMEFRRTDESGRTTWHLVSAAPLHGSDGRIVAAIATNQDVTAVKLAEDALRAGEARYRTLFESIDEGFCIQEMIHDEDGRPVDYRFLEVNPAFERHTGLEHATGRTIRELAPDLEQTWFDTYDRVARTGEPIRFQRHGAALGRWFDVYAFRTGDADRPLVAALFTDVTDRKRAEAEVARAREYAESIVETLHEPLLVLKPDLTVDSANAAFYQHFEVEPDATIGRPIYELGNGQWDIPALRTLLEDVLPDSNVFNDFEVRHDFEDLGERVMLLNARRLDHVQLILLGIRDITGRKRAEEVLQQARADLEARVAARTRRLHDQADRLRRLSHELSAAEHRERKRLAALLHDDLQQHLVALKMRLFAFSARRGPGVDEEITRSLEHADEALRASRDLTRELRPPVLYEDGLVAALEWLAGDMETRHGLAVAVDAEGFPGVADETIRAMLFEGTRELLFNVVKHAGVDEVLVTCRRTGDRIRVVVADHGAGFDVEEVAQRRREGGGLGLFSIRERLESIGGRLHCRSVPGDGAEIAMELPIGLAESGPAGTALPSAAGASPAAARETGAGGPDAEAAAWTVLVVDDHAVVRQGIVTLIGEDDRVQVVGEASDGSAALEAVDRLEPDLVLMDVNLPGMSGIEATRRIRTRRPATRVVAFSVQDDPATRRSMADAGATGFLSKSADSDTMVRTVLEACSRHP